MNRLAAALVLATGGMLVTAGPTMAAFQIVDLSATSGEPGDDVAIHVDASHLIGGSKQSQLFLVPRNAITVNRGVTTTRLPSGAIGSRRGISGDDASPESARCDEIPGATVVGELRWHAAAVEFQGETYPGFVGTGSFTVPDVETGIYVVAGILDDPYTGCHVYAPFGVGMDLPDTATREPPTSRYPAAGICVEPEQGPVATFVIAVDVPQPRCGYVRATQRLRIDNLTDQSVRVKLNGSWQEVKPHGSKLFPPRFGEIWEPGVHRLPTDYYAGGGPEAWLRDRLPDSAIRQMTSPAPMLVGLALLLLAAVLVMTSRPRKGQSRWD